MLAIIDIDVAGNFRRKIWLAAGESLRIGRTEQADVALPMDAQLAPVHFTLHCNKGDCLVQASADNELRLNGRATRRSPLQDGDVLHAGNSRFTVTLEGVPRAPAPTTVLHGEPPVEHRADAARQCVVERAVSGAHIHRCRGAGQAGSELLEKLAAVGFLHAVVERHTDGAAPGSPRAPLFDWLSDRVAWASPDIVLELPLDAPRSEGDLGDATYLVADRTGGELLEHLRLAARGQTSRDQQPSADRMLLAFEPGQLEEVLPHCDAEYVNFVFSKLTAILFTSPDAQEWTVISGQSLTDTFRQLDFEIMTRVTSERPAATTLSSFQESTAATLEAYSS